jgi:hypothetical protein
LIFKFAENNLMGAAEWTGYSSPTVAPSYSTSFQPSYEQSSMLPAVISNEGIAYNPSDYHCGTSATQNPSYAGTSQFSSIPAWSNEVDQYNYGYASYPQYPYQTAPQTQFPPPLQTAPPQTQGTAAQTTMVLCPQLYSTVNQNQIHLHLHGSDKLVEQYLGSSTAPSSTLPTDNNAFSLSSVVGGNQRAIGGLEVPSLSTPSDDLNKHHQQQQQHHQPVDPSGEVVDQSVWRPY